MKGNKTAYASILLAAALWGIIGLWNRELMAAGLSPTSRGVLVFRRVTTFLLVCFAWVFFRANTISDAFTLVGALFTNHASLASALSAMQLDAVSILLIIFSVATMILLDRALTYDEQDGSDILVKDGAFIYYVFAIMFVWLLLLSKGQESTFIYFQF